MKRTITLLLALLAGIFSLSAQQFTNPFEVLVKEGATDVSFKIGGKTNVKINWGDGTEESVKLDSDYGTTVKHTYKEALTQTTTVTFEATEVTLFRSDFNESGSIIGVGDINAPNLITFSYSPFKGGTLAKSKNGIVDFTNCPKLKKIQVRNVPHIKLGSHPDLQTLWISSSTSPDKQDYAQLNNEEIDLSKCPNLQDVLVMQQKNVKTINVSGLTKLTKFYWIQGYNWSNAIGLRDITKNKELVDFSIGGHSLPLSQLPDKNPEVANYTTYNIKYPYDGYAIPEDKKNGASIDLSDMLTEYDFQGNEYHGTVEWKTAGYVGKTIEPEHYTLENGVYTFKESVLGDKEEIQLEAHFKPAYFKLADISGSSYDPSLKSTAITLKKEFFKQEEKTPYVSFTTDKPIGSKISIQVDTDAKSPIKIEGATGTVLVGNFEYDEITTTAQTITIKGDVTVLWIKEETAGITSIDLTHAPRLQKARLAGNLGLKQIDVSKNTELVQLYIPNTAVSALDVTGLSKLELLEVQQSDLSLDAMTALIATLPNQKGGWGADLIVQEEGATNKVEVYKDDVAKAKEKGWKTLIAAGVDTKPYEGIDRETPKPAEKDQISFTTSKKVGDKLLLQIEGEGEITAEGLEPATIALGKGELTEYKLTAQNVVIKGDITHFKTEESHICAIDFTKAPKLQVISMYEKNEFEAVDLSQNNALKEIYIDYGKLKSIQLPTEKENLEELSLSGNKFKSEDLNIAEYTNLYLIDLSENKLETIDVSPFEDLQYLYVDWNKLTKLDLSKNTAIEELSLKMNNLNSLEVSHLENLSYLNCSFNWDIATLDVSHNTQLKTLRATLCPKISEIDVTPCTDLRHLNLNGTNITTLDISKNTELTYLNVSSTKITSIDLSKQENLTDFLAGGVAIDNFDFSHNSALEYIFVPNTKINSLNVSGLNNLMTLTLFSNALEPKAMHDIAEALPQIPLKDEYGKPISGWLVIQNLAENATIKEKKGLDPIQVYKEDVTKLKGKNWKVLVYDNDNYDYLDYGEGIDKAAERIAQGKWYVAYGNGVATIFHAPEGSSYTVYSFEGTRLLSGTIHSAEEKINISQLPEGAYLFTIKGETQVVIK